MYFLNHDETQQAACTNADPELFFPIAKADPSIPQAIAVCRSCPFTSRCLEWALENNEIGIWGGTTDDQRLALRKRVKLPV